MLLKLMDEGRVMVAWLTDVTLAMAFVGVATGLVVWIEPASSGSGIPDLKVPERHEPAAAADGEGAGLK